MTRVSILWGSLPLLAALAGSAYNRSLRRAGVPVSPHKLAVFALITFAVCMPVMFLPFAFTPPTEWPVQTERILVLLGLGVAPLLVYFLFFVWPLRLVRRWENAVKLRARKREQDRGLTT